MSTDQEGRQTQREGIMQLYDRYLSKRRKKYLDPNSTSRILPTPAKKQCIREGTDSHEENGSFAHPATSKAPSNNFSLCDEAQFHSSVHEASDEEAGNDDTEAPLTDVASSDEGNTQSCNYFRVACAREGRHSRILEESSDEADTHSHHSGQQEASEEDYRNSVGEAADVACSNEGNTDYNSSDQEREGSHSSVLEAQFSGLTSSDEGESESLSSEQGEELQSNNSEPPSTDGDESSDNGVFLSHSSDQPDEIRNTNEEVGFNRNDNYEQGDPNAGTDGMVDEINNPHDDNQGENHEQGNRDEDPMDRNEDEANLVENNEDPMDRNEDEANPIENNEGQEIPNNRQGRKQSLRQLINGPYSEPVNVGVDTTRSDLLYMALGSAKQNNFSNKSFNDSVQLLNSIFNEPVLPTSLARLDSMLMDKTGVKYFFYCETCTKSFGELDYLTIKTKLCENCNTVNTISDLRVAHYFCMFDLSHALEALLNQVEIKNALLKPSDAVNLGKEGELSDLYSGAVYKDFARQVANFIECVISLHFCTDGAALFKSSKNSIWPIMFCVNELPPVLRMKNILLGGLWFGKSQPPMNLLLVPLSEQAARLSNGFVIQVNNEPLNMRAYIIGCCVDSGARGKVQGIKSHGGYNACNWCCITGEHIAGAVRYPMTEVCPKRRTHQEMLRIINRIFREVLDDQQSSESDQSDEDDLGVQDASPLINVPMFNMVEGFFVEPMHLLSLGITKTHLLKWLEEPGDFNISDSSAEIDRRLASLKPPLEFRRMPRLLLEKARYKARELDNWLSYCIIPVLTGILPQKYLRLWFFFAQAIYLLSQSEVTYPQVNTADALLKYFVCVSQQYYGKEIMVFNMHLLTHLAEHVARWGPVWAASAYCFENFNGFLLKIIKTQLGVPNQVIRSLSWDQAIRILEPFVSEKARKYVGSLPKQKRQGIDVEDCTLMGVPSLFSPTAEEKWFCDKLGCDITSCELYPEMIRNRCVFSVQQKRKTNNTIAQLTDKSIVQVKKIVYERQQDKVYLFASKVLTEPIFDPPPGIRLHLSEYCMRKVSHIEEELCCFPSSNLKIICFLAEFEYGSFVAPLPNVCNVF